jgi:cysteine desulfurase
MMPYWQEAFGNAHSVDHAVGWSAAKAVQEAAAAVATLIGADANEIVFTSGATEANNFALLGLAHRAPPSRRRILVSTIEHKCVLATAQVIGERYGIRVDPIPVGREGFVDLNFLSGELDDSVLAVSIMAVNNEIGTIQDIPAISGLLEHYGVLLHCDAAQAPCAMDVSELATYADLLSLSGHKIYGPQGIGALYIRRDAQNRIEPLIYGGGQQEGLRSGTVPVALAVGMGAAAKILHGPEQETERERIAGQRDCFVRLLTDGAVTVTLNGPVGEERHPGNANLQFDHLSAKDLLNILQPRLAASTGSACTSGIPEPSHVLRAIGLNGEQADASARFSFGRFTTDDEISQAVCFVKDVLVTALR